MYLNPARKLKSNIDYKFSNDAITCKNAGEFINRTSWDSSNKENFVKTRLECYVRFPETI